MKDWNYLHQLGGSPISARVKAMTEEINYVATSSVINQVKSYLIGQKKLHQKRTVYICKIGSKTLMIEEQQLSYCNMVINQVKRLHVRLVQIA